MQKPSDALMNLRILVVEDEVVISMMIEDLLEELGCLVTAASSISSALEALRTTSLDGVLLDMNIQGERPIAVAEELADRSIPFLLVTGYGAGDADPPLIKAAPRLQKPFNGQELARRMAELFLYRDRTASRQSKSS